MSDALRDLAALARRFQGVDLSYRRDADWPQPWRAVNHTSKRERSSHRLTGWGETPEAAVRSLIDLVAAADARIC